MYNKFCLKCTDFRYTQRTDQNVCLQYLRYKRPAKQVHLRQRNNDIAGVELLPGTSAGHIVVTRLFLRIANFIVRSAKCITADRRAASSLPR